MSILGPLTAILDFWGSHRRKMCIQNLFQYQPSDEGGPRSPPAKSKCRQGAPKWLTGSRLLGILSNFRKISILIRALLLSEKVATEAEKKRGGKKLMKIVATTSLPVVYSPNDDRWNAAHSYQKLIKGSNSI